MLPPEAFVLLILATSWLDLPRPDPEIQVLELFAGEARLSRLSKSLGLGVAAHDILYDKAATSSSMRSAMDFNESAGLLPLDFLFGSFTKS